MGRLLTASLGIIALAGAAVVAARWGPGPDAAVRPHPVAPPAAPPAPARARPDGPNLRWIDHRSPMLSARDGRDVFHRCGVALPAGYDDPGAPSAWPTVYVVPDLGERDDGAFVYAQMLATPGVEDIAPIAVYVVLDPASTLGHHGFTDSATHGPRATALVEELIPALEARFRLAPRAEARVLTGNGFGGWTSLWLLLARPDVFGAAWASSPAPVDLRAFPVGDLYADDNLYRDARGAPRPAFRVLATIEGDMKPAMTVREEVALERPDGPFDADGLRWRTWEAMFSPAGAEPRKPRPMFDRATGAIDASVVAHWRRFDLSRMVADDWQRLGPVVTERVHVACGALDSYYYDRAVRLFKERVETLAAEGGGWRGPGVVEIIPDKTHAELTGAVFQRWNQEMRAYFGERGLHD